MSLWQRVLFSRRSNKQISTPIALQYGSRRRFAKLTPLCYAAEQGITLESSVEAVAKASKAYQSKAYQSKVPVRKHAVRHSKRHGSKIPVRTVVVRDSKRYRSKTPVRTVVVRDFNAYESKIPIRIPVARASKAYKSKTAVGTVVRASKAYKSKTPVRTVVIDLKKFRKVHPRQDPPTVTLSSAASASGEETDRDLSSTSSSEATEQSSIPLIRRYLYQKPINGRPSVLEVPLSINAVRRQDADSKHAKRRLPKILSAPAVKAKLGKPHTYVMRKFIFDDDEVKEEKKPQTGLDDPPCTTDEAQLRKPPDLVRKFVFNEEKLTEKKKVEAELDDLLYTYNKVQLRKSPGLVRDNAIEWPSRRKHKRWQRLDQVGQPTEEPSWDHIARNPEETIVKAERGPLRISLTYDDNPVDPP